MRLGKSITSFTAGFMENSIENKFFRTIKKSPVPIDPEMEKAIKQAIKKVKAKREHISSIQRNT